MKNVKKLERPMFHLKVVESDKNWTTASNLGPGGQPRQLEKIKKKVKSKTNHLLQRKLASDTKAISEKVLHLKYWTLSSGEIMLGWK